MFNFSSNTLSSSLKNKFLKKFIPCILLFVALIPSITLAANENTFEGRCKYKNAKCSDEFKYTEQQCFGYGEIQSCPFDSSKKYCKRDTEIACSVGEYYSAYLKNCSASSGDIVLETTQDISNCKIAKENSTWSSDSLDNIASTDPCEYHGGDYEIASEDVVLYIYNSFGNIYGPLNRREHIATKEGSVFNESNGSFSLNKHSGEVFAYFCIGTATCPASLESGNYKNDATLKQALKNTCQAGTYINKTTEQPPCYTSVDDAYKSDYYLIVGRQDTTLTVVEYSIAEYSYEEAKKNNLCANTNIDTNFTNSYANTLSQLIPSFNHIFLSSDDGYPNCLACSNGTCSNPGSHYCPAEEWSTASIGVYYLCLKQQTINMVDKITLE